MYYTSIWEPNCHKETDLKQHMTLWTGNLRLKTLNHNLKDMKQIDVEVSTIISMNYDPESEEFKDSLKSYQDAIESSASEEDMLRQIAWYITAFGTENMIEGIGYVSVDGEKNGDPEDWCGVDIVNSFNINDTPDFQTAII